MTTVGGPLVPGAHSARIDGIVQRYNVAGTGPVCVVHPGGPGINWEYLRLPLLESKLTTVYLEPVGTGASGLLPDGDYGMKRYAYFARALIDLLGVHRPHFLGHSHGGCVGLQLAIDNPGGLGGLILYDSGPCSRTGTAPHGGGWARALRPAARWQAWSKGRRGSLGRGRGN